MKSLWSQLRWKKKLIYFIWDKLVGSKELIDKFICFGNNGISYRCQISFRGKTEKCDQFYLIEVDIVEYKDGVVEFARTIFNF
jgi:hypothetical protein